MPLESSMLGLREQCYVKGEDPCVSGLGLPPEPATQAMGCFTPWGPAQWSPGRPRSDWACTPVPVRVGRACRARGVHCPLPPGEAEARDPLLVGVGVTPLASGLSTVCSGADVVVGAPGGVSRCPLWVTAGSVPRPEPSGQSLGHPCGVRRRKRPRREGHSARWAWGRRRPLCLWEWGQWGCRSGRRSEAAAGAPGLVAPLSHPGP